MTLRIFSKSLLAPPHLRVPVVRKIPSKAIELEHAEKVEPAFTLFLIRLHLDGVYFSGKQSRPISSARNKHPAKYFVMIQLKFGYRWLEVSIQKRKKSVRSTI